MSPEIPAIVTSSHVSGSRRAQPPTHLRAPRYGRSVDSKLRRRSVGGAQGSRKQKTGRLRRWGRWLARATRVGETAVRGPDPEARRGGAKRDRRDRAGDGGKGSRRGARLSTARERSCRHGSKSRRVQRTAAELPTPCSTRITKTGDETVAAPVNYI